MDIYIDLKQFVGSDVELRNKEININQIEILWRLEMHKMKK